MPGVITVHDAGGMQIATLPAPRRVDALVFGHGRLYVLEAGSGIIICYHRPGGCWDVEARRVARRSRVPDVSSRPRTGGWSCVRARRSSNSTATDVSCAVTEFHWQSVSIGARRASWARRRWCGRRRSCEEVRRIGVLPNEVTAALPSSAAVSFVPTVSPSPDSTRATTRGRPLEVVATPVGSVEAARRSGQSLECARCGDPDVPISIVEQFDHRRDVRRRGEVARDARRLAPTVRVVVDCGDWTKRSSRAARSGRRANASRTRTDAPSSCVRASPAFR